MDRNFARALPYVRQYEGGWVDNAKDPGGATNKGVTLSTFRSLVKPKATKDDLRNITDAQVESIYYKSYWAPAGCAMLPAGVDFAVFDFAINSGVYRAAQYLQKTVGAKQDGKVGPATVAAVEAYGASRTIKDLCASRLAYMKRIKHKKTGALLWPTFGKGWQRRVDSVEVNALKMVGNPADVEKVSVPKPEVPQAVDDKVKQKTNRWGWLGTVGSALSAGAAAIGGADWQTIAAIGGAGVIFLLIIILLRGQIAKAIADIRKAVETE